MRRAAVEQLIDGPRAQEAEDVGHLERGARGLGALVALRAAGTGLGLLAVVAGEHAEGDRDARLERGQLEPARGLAGDVVEVRRLAADDAAEATTQEYWRVRARAIAPSGSSKAPGTGTTSMRSRSTPAPPEPRWRRRGAGT